MGFWAISKYSCSLIPSYYAVVLPDMGEIFSGRVAIYLTSFNAYELARYKGMVYVFCGKTIGKHLHSVHR